MPNNKKTFIRHFRFIFKIITPLISWMKKETNMSFIESHIRRLLEEEKVGERIIPLLEEMDDQCTLLRKNKKTQKTDFPRLN